jgi:Protein of unknown function (DUF3618)
MTNDTRTSDEIERDISEERARMSDTINNLQKKFSVDAIVGDIGGMFRGQGGEIGRAISSTVGRNPAALALVGVGLAWLLIGRDRSSHASKSAGREQDDNDTWSTAQSWDKRLARSAGIQSDESDPFWLDDDVSVSGGRSSSRRENMRGTESDSAVMGTLRSAAGAVGDAVTGAAGSVSDAASSLTQRLSHGLEGFSEEAKSRVMAARRAAYDARAASAEAMKKGTRMASNLFEDQPLVVGALAVALGAAVGSALPRTKLEDETLGDTSNHLIAEAEALFRAEKAKLMAAAKTAAAEVKSEVGAIRNDLAELLPEGKTVGDVIVDRAADAAARVADRAVGEISEPLSDRHNT